MNRREYGSKVAEALTAQGVTVDPVILARALGRAGRHAAAKYGRVDWDAEHNESGVGSGTWFYREAAADGGRSDARTFNRDRVTKRGAR